MKFVIGSAQFGLRYGIGNQQGKVSIEEVRKIINTSINNKIDTIDTAIGYGESEAVLGKVGIKKWKVISKLPEIPLACLNVKEWVYTQVGNSLKRLDINSLYALLLHRPNQLFSEKGPSIYEALQQLKEEGFIQKIGVSIYKPEELTPLFEDMQFDLVQAPFSLLDQRLSLSGWIEKLKLMGVELHVRSIFLQGLLLMPPYKRPPYFTQWGKIWEEWDRWLACRHLTPLEACIRYAFSVEGIDKIVIGIDSLSQLCQILDVSTDKLEGLPAWPSHIEPKLINPSLWS